MTLTVFTKLRNTTVKNLKIQSVENEREINHKSNVEDPAFVKLKTGSKDKMKNQQKSSEVQSKELKGKLKRLYLTGKQFEKYPQIIQLWFKNSSFTVVVKNYLEGQII